MFQSEAQNRAATAMPRPIRLYVKYVDAASQGFGILAMYLIFIMIGVLIFDAFMRNVVMIPLNWAIEFAQFTLAAYYILGGAYSLKNGEHVRMDLLYDWFSEKGKARMDVITDSFLIFYLICLFIGSISSTLYAIKYDQRNFSMWNPSMIPIKVIMVFGIALIILQAFSIFFKDAAKAFEKEI